MYSSTSVLQLCNHRLHHGVDFKNESAQVVQRFRFRRRRRLRSCGLRVHSLRTPPFPFIHRHRSSWSSATRSSTKRPCRTLSSSWRTTCSAISATTQFALRTALSSAACSPSPAATPPTRSISFLACSSRGSSPRCRRPSSSPTTPRCSKPSLSTASPSTFASFSPLSL